MVRIVALTTVLLLAALPVAAQDWVVGVEGNEAASFSYVTHYSRRPLGPSTSLVYWQTASYLTYRLREGAVTTRVKSPGLDAGAMYRWTSPRTSAGIGAGYEMRWTERDVDGLSTVSETEQGPIILGDAATRLARRTTGRVGARYSAANRWRALSADVRQAITPRLGIGPQVIWQGNEDIDVLSAGGFVEIPFGRSALQIRAGQSRIEERDGRTERRPYFSAGIVVPF